MKKKTEKKGIVKLAIVILIALLFIVVILKLRATVFEMFNRTGIDGPIKPLNERVEIERDVKEGK